MLTMHILKNRQKHPMVYFGCTLGWQNHLKDERKWLHKSQYSYVRAFTLLRIPEPKMYLTR